MPAALISAAEWLAAALAWAALVPLGAAAFAHPTPAAAAPGQAAASVVPPWDDSWWIRTPAERQALLTRAGLADPSAADRASGRQARQQAHALLELLARRGVHLRISDDITPEASAEWDSRRAEIRVRPWTVVLGQRALLQTLAHEAVHVAQSCRAGGINQAGTPLGLHVEASAASDAQLASAHWRGLASDRQLELEAYTVAGDPSWAIRLLASSCREP
jgi:hypothetical protein